MMNGLIPYRDMYEQKGPLLYLLHGIAWIASERSFIGIYYMELLASILYLYFSYKILTLCVQHKTALAMVPLIAILTYTSFSFMHGDSAEEFCLPIIAYSLYISARYFHNRDWHEPSLWHFLVQGILAGCILWIKFTILGFHFGLMLTLFLFFIFQKKWQYAFKAPLVFLTGMLAATLPWVVYFGIHGAISDWFTVYFYDNIFRYTNELSPARPFITMPVFFAKASWHNEFIPALLLLGCLRMAFLPKAHLSLFEKVNYSLPLFFAFLGISIGGVMRPYYFLIIIPLLIYGCGPVLALMHQKWDKELQHGARYWPVILLISIGFALMHAWIDIQKLGMLDDLILRSCQKFVGFIVFGGLFLLTIFAGNSTTQIFKNSFAKHTGALLICAVFSFLLSQNTYLLCADKNTLPQYQFAKIIESKKNATLLNYGFLDGGIYTTTGIIPSTKYFSWLNLRSPEMADEQNRIVNEGLVDFVVCRTNGETPNLPLYTLRAQTSFVMEYEVFQYFLFERKAR